MSHASLQGLGEILAAVSLALTAAVTVLFRSPIDAAEVLIGAGLVIESSRGRLRFDKLSPLGDTGTPKHQRSSAKYPDSNIPVTFHRVCLHNNRLLIRRENSARLDRVLAVCCTATPCDASKNARPQFLL